MRPPNPEQITQQLRAAIDTGDGTEIDRLGALLDSVDRPRSTPQLLPSALWYASVGLPVFPLQPLGKRPLPKSHGCKDATTDAATIRAWWSEQPEANIGIATGHLVDVIDIDGAIGVQSWARLEDVPPILGRIATPRPGGTHHYIAATGEGNRAKMFPGIDYRGVGGYVIAPPSVLDERYDSDGELEQHAGVYSWTVPLHLEAAAEAA